MIRRQWLRSQISTVVVFCGKFDRTAQIQGKVQQTDLCRYIYSTYWKSACIRRISLQVHVIRCIATNVRSCVHRHGQSYLSYRMRQCLRDYKISLNSTWAIIKRTYASREQKSTRPDEEWEQRCDNDCIHWTQSDNVRWGWIAQRILKKRKV